MLVNSKDLGFVPGLAKAHASFASVFTFGFQKLRADWDRFPNVACHSFANSLKFDFLMRVKSNSMETSEHALGYFPLLFSACIQLLVMLMVKLDEQK